MKPPTIAVIVPNRNHARFLPRCLRSVLDQDVPPDELIVVDDQSTDDSVTVVRSTIAGHNRAQLIVNPVNLGTNGALNEGLKRTQSEYVLFLASNDFVLPGIFARAKAGLAGMPRVALWSAMAWMVDEGDRPIRLHPSAVVSMTDARLTPQRCIELAYRYGNWFTGTSAIYHRDTLREVGGFDPEYGAPSDLITALTVASLKGAAYTPAPLCAIRIHDNSYSSRALKDPEGLEAMMNRLRLRGPRLSPGLFTEAFVDRMAQRYRFAAVRAADGDVGGVEPYTRGPTRTLLRVLHRFVPYRWRTVRVALAFFVLRPFDVVPTITNR
ncbi:MAG: glycosyltransferase family 2 protein, partial [Burkholderiales bacterium]